MTNLPKVLFVEDDYNARWMWKRELEGKITPLEARNHDEAQAVFNENPDIKIVVMDGSLDKYSFGQIDTIPLVKRFRETFSGPMIAASSDFRNCNLLLQAGCTHSVAGDKDDVPKIVQAALLEIAKADLTQTLDSVQPQKNTVLTMAS